MRTRRCKKGRYGNQPPTACLVLFISPFFCTNETQPSMGTLKYYLEKESVQLTVIICALLDSGLFLRCTLAQIGVNGEKSRVKQDFLVFLRWDLTCIDLNSSPVFVHCVLSAECRKTLACQQFFHVGPSSMGKKQPMKKCFAVANSGSALFIFPMSWNVVIVPCRASCLWPRRFTEALSWRRIYNARSHTVQRNPLSQMITY